MNHRQRVASKRLTFARPRLEELECRLTPAFAPGAVLSLELVALHEFGHALGLGHIDSAPSIMNSTYNAEYSIDLFLSGQDPAVIQLQGLYSGANVLSGASPWQDGMDANPGNNAIDLTYSFAGETRGGSSFVDAMNEQFGGPSWQLIFVSVADYWSVASGGTLIITFVDEDLPAGFGGNIRIGGSSMDGPGGVLAVGAEPPSGEINFDMDEVWGEPLDLKFMDDNVSVFGGDDGEDDEPLMAPVINMPRQFVAIFEASRDLQTVVVFSDLTPVRVLQVQIDPPVAVPQAAAHVANVGWGQHSQADLYKVVFLPVLPDSEEEAAEVMPDAVTPAQQPRNDARPDATAPVRNDPSVQTQTPQLSPQSSSPDEEQSDAVGVSTVFDAGTALAGLALFMGGYWAVPQEEERKRFFN